LTFFAFSLYHLVRDAAFPPPHVPGLSRLRNLVPAFLRILFSLLLVPFGLFMAARLFSFAPFCGRAYFLLSSRGALGGLAV
jgi:hypothetical protein